MEATEKQEIDWLLQMMVHVVNETCGKDNPAFPAVTLMVGGILVSGEIIDQSTYLKSIGNGSLVDIMKEALSKYDEKRGTSAKDTDDLDQYIHLREVHICTPISPVKSIGEKAPLWRGKLSSVDGYCFGAVRMDVTAY